MQPNPKPVLRILVLVLTLGMTLPQVLPGQPLPPEAPKEPPTWDDPSLPTAADRSQEMDAFLARLLASSDPSPASSEPPMPPTREDLERDAFGALRDQGHAPIVATPDGLLHPFGHGTPKLTCIPDRACDVALEAGEVIDGLAVGDPANWQTTFLTEGVGPDPIPHILLQPTGANLKTNLVVVTSRRTYHVELTSPPEDELARNDTVYQHLAFWYPERWTRKLRHNLKQDTPDTPASSAESAWQAQDPPDPSEPASLPETAVDLDRLDFGYEIDFPWRRKRRLPWKPTSVFDDGRNVYLHLPPVARATDLPVVLGRAPDGSTFPVNAHLQGARGDWIVLPALIDEIELVTGAGDERRFLRIRHEGERGGAS